MVSNSSTGHRSLKRRKNCFQTQKDQQSYQPSPSPTHQSLSSSSALSSKFNKIIFKRLNLTRVNRFPISISRIIKNLTQKNKDKIFAVVGTVTNDNRILEVPALHICALRFTESARKRIIENKGKCYTFDQLAQINPLGKGVILLRGPKVREEFRHFGLYPGQKGSHTAPYVRSKGHKFEKARGRT